MASSTQGVPPMRSSVENVNQCSLQEMLALVISTHSSFALDSSPMSKAPSIDPLPAVGDDHAGAEIEK